MAQAPVAKKQLGLDVPVPLLNTLQGISATSGITMTQLLATALEMIAVVYQAEDRGGIVLVHNQQGQAESVLTVPRLGVHQIPLASLKAVAQGENTTGVTAVPITPTVPDHAGQPAKAGK